MAAVTASQLGAFLGRSVETSQANSVIQTVTSMARSYTRNQGFVDGVPNDEIASVVLTASARLISNTSGLRFSEAKGPESLQFQSVFDGWTLSELFVLNRFRVTAL